MRGLYVILGAFGLFLWFGVAMAWKSIIGIQTVENFWEWQFATAVQWSTLCIAVVYGMFLSRYYLDKKEETDDSTI